MEWQTWDVMPRGLNERRVNERRSRLPVPVQVDRRTSRDRRVVAGNRPLLRSGLDGGWLCFETPSEKRRLAPIPNDWQRCPEQKLEEYCQQARPARRSSVELPSLPKIR
jgi:hypothetical protein